MASAECLTSLDEKSVNNRPVTAVPAASRMVEPIRMFVRSSLR